MHHEMDCRWESFLVVISKYRQNALAMLLRSEHVNFLNIP